jgi:hypothetical protein
MLARALPAVPVAAVLPRLAAVPALQGKEILAALVLPRSLWTLAAAAAAQQVLAAVRFQTPGAALVVTERRHLSAVHQLLMLAVVVVVPLELTLLH